MRWQARSEPLFGSPRVTALRDGARLYGGLALLAAMCLATSAAIVAGGVFQPRARRRRFARALVSSMVDTYLRVMMRAGSLRLDLSALDALRGAPAMVIAPNHPSMIDAALVLSRLPDVTCIMKAEILHNPLFGSGARACGYITNEPPRSMLRAAVDNLHEGGHLLLFPEGTRTRSLPLNTLQRTVGVIAKRAGVPVQTVIIEADTPFFAKGWPLLRVPPSPMQYRVRLGRRFDPPADVDVFTMQLQTYFESELADARLPALPVKP